MIFVAVNPAEIASAVCQEAKVVPHQAKVDFVVKHVKQAHKVWTGQLSQELDLS